MSVFVHPSSIVSSGARIGDGAWIGPFCIVVSDVEIGEDTRLEAYVRVLEYVRIGSRCHVYENVVLGGEPQDFGFKGERSWVRIGDDVTLRENVTIHRGSGEDSVTSIGNGTWMMVGSHAGHNVTVGAKCVLANGVQLSGYSSVGDGAILGGLSGLHQFVKAGRLCMIGGLTKAVKDIPPFTLADGHPAKIHGLNTVGLRRNGFSQEQRLAIKRTYRKLFDPSSLIRETLKDLENASPDDPNIMEIVQFMKESKRGITRWGNRRGQDD